MRILSYSLPAYLSLANSALSKLRGKKTVCITSEMESANIRLFTFVAPNDHCWGMDLSRSKTYSSWLDRLAERTELVRSVRREIKVAGRKVSEIAQGLVPVGSDAGGNELAYGTDENALEIRWFRSYAVSVAVDSDAVLSLWKRHQSQLGKFFLLPYEDARVRDLGVDPCNSSSWKQSLLCRLFWEPRGLGGAELGDQVKLLSEYQDEAKMRGLDALLTPDFLLQEYVRWSVSIVPSVTSLRALAAEVYRETFGSSELELFDTKTMVAILRLRIARALQWPIGVRLMIQQIEPYAGRADLPALVAEAKSYVSSALTTFPVLAE